MNSKKLARFFGKVAGLPQEMPIIQVAFDASHLGKVPPGGGTDSEVGSFIGCANIDPPVGGFAPGDIIWQVPAATAFTSVIVPVVVDTNRRFAPGLYNISGHYIPPGAGVTVTMQILAVNPDGTLPPPYGAKDYPTMNFSNPGAGTGVQSWSFQAYFHKPWFMRMIATGALVDANVMSISMQVLPVHLLDDNPSAS